MSVDNIPSNPTPLWVKIVIILAMLPVALYPVLLSRSVDDTASVRGFLWLYPLYVLAAGICAWISYGRRPEITWILVVMLILTHIGMWMLVLNPQL